MAAHIIVYTKLPAQDEFKEVEALIFDWEKTNNPKDYDVNSPSKEFKGKVSALICFYTSTGPQFHITPFILNNYHLDIIDYQTNRSYWRWPTYDYNG